MTVLAAALVGDNGLVLAADGKAMYVESAEKVRPGFAGLDAIPVQKWKQVGDRPLMVGIYGCTLTGPSLKALTEPPPEALTSFDAYVAHAAAHLERVNRNFREKAAKAGTKPEQTEMVVAGTIDGTPRITYIDDTGLTGHRMEDAPVGPWFFGLNAATVRVSYGMASSFSLNLNLGNPATMRTFMERLFGYLPDFLLPVNVWRITEDGVEQIP
jgi:hypothetical protein